MSGTEGPLSHIEGNHLFVKKCSVQGVQGL